uniref:tRNA-splicing endonuclease subunit Sen54 N-terminal domain-containing protein n=1 Tax=Anopheles farauti TaxID=69004 RepID=A0A182QNW7_9DIPT
MRNSVCIPCDGMAYKSEEKCGLLSGKDMVKHHTESYELQAQFNRLVSLEEFGDSRQNDLERMKEQLRLLLSQERVSNLDSISEGCWENDEQRVRITKLEGKWQTFGYEDSTGKYVESHEALFLMEMVQSSQPMPHFKELQKAYQQQKTAVPLMLMLVSDTLSVHCFLYDLRRVSRNIISLPDESKASSSR